MFVKSEMVDVVTHICAYRMEKVEDFVDALMKLKTIQTDNVLTTVTKFVLL